MTEIEQADDLYQEFPDFAAWTGLTAYDVELWDRFAENLAAKRAAAPPAAFGKSVEIAMRAAALDTGAIEGLYSVDRGFTLTVAMQALAWQHMLDERGPAVRSLFEAQLAAYELVLDAATRKLPISEAWIRALHETVCRAQPTYRVLTQLGWQDHALARGRYKTAPNHVRLADGGLHAYAPVERAPVEMHRMVDVLASPGFEAAHPLLQASYAHYALVNVHPFADGNGRVARALASVYFYRAASIPLVVFADQRHTYFDALEKADRGDAAPVVAFFRERALDTMQLAGDNLAQSSGRQPDEVAEDLRGLHGDREAIALRLLAAIEAGLSARLAELRLPEAIEGGLERQDRHTDSEAAGWMLAGSQIALDLQESRSPSRRAEARFRVLIATDPVAYFDFRLEVAGSDDSLDVRRDQIDPELQTIFRLRLSAWIDRQLARTLAELRA